MTKAENLFVSSLNSASQLGGDSPVSPSRLWHQPCCEVGGIFQHGTKFPRFSLLSTVIHGIGQYRTCSKANPRSLKIRTGTCCPFMLRQSCHTLQKPTVSTKSQEQSRGSTYSNALSNRGPKIQTNCGRVAEVGIETIHQARSCKAKVPASSFPENHTEQTSCGGSHQTHLREQLSGRPCRLSPKTAVSLVSIGPTPWTLTKQ